jgi:hypothetical protein
MFLVAVGDFNEEGFEALAISKTLLLIEILLFNH